MNKEHDVLTPEVRFHLIRKMERHKVIALTGPRLLPHERKYLEFHSVSGVILFGRNIESLSQVGDLIGGVCEELAREGLTPLVMADHEGDFVAELRQIIGVPPAPLAIAATGDLDLAAEVAYETGKAMRKLGANVVLAPVADCYLESPSAITGLRTFGADPGRVAAFVEQTIAGFREAGVLSCAKHFPGHGSTAEDSHETLPEVRKSAEDLAAADLIPFRRSIGVGVDLMMMSHVAYPMGREELIPASFDARIIRGMLRTELNYDGVVITDALEMAGARWYASERSGMVTGGNERSLLAGSDLLLHTKPIPEQVQVERGSEPVMSLNVMETIVRTLEKIVDRGRVDEKLAEAAAESEPLRNVLSILDASSARVTKLRERAADPRASARPAGGKVIELNAYPSVPTVYRTVAERSITAGSDWVRFQALAPDSTCVVLPVEWSPSETLKKQDMAGFLDVVCRHFPRWHRMPLVTEFETDAEGSLRPVFQRERATVVDAARFAGGTGAARELANEEVVMVFSSRGAPSEEFALGLTALADEYRPSVVVLTGWIVDDWVPEGTPIVISLGASTQVASAVAQVLAGALVPEGSLAGLLPAAYPRP
ncbi:MAG TPA: glycoside hydrolase family 3 N-terminal domain-containing protein [Candidatus Krumholzibacteria bacterium]|nr:glycoside hydrolase family 3 N-terminal domain-containing protein [Candidatus Krumholzibacteria bacterium]